MNITEKNALANYGGAAVSAIMGLAFIPLYISYLGEESFALIAVVALIQTWASLIDGGISSAIGRDISRYRNNPSKVGGLANLVTSAEYIFFGIVILIGFLGLFLKHRAAIYWPDTTSIDAQQLELGFLLIFILAGIRVLEGLYRSILLALERQVMANVWLAASATLKAGGSIFGLIFLSWDVVHFFVWQIVCSIGFCIVLRYSSLSFFSTKNAKGIWSFSSLWSLRKFTGGVMLISVSSLLISQIDKILIFSLLSLKEFGIYMFAATVANSVNLLIYPISQAFYPRFCEYFEQAKWSDLATHLHKSSQLIIVIVGSIVVSFAFLSYEILAIWTKDLALTESSALLITALMVGNLISGVNIIPQQLQLARGTTSVIRNTNFLVLVLLVPLMQFGFHYSGVLGVAASWIFIHILYNLIILLSINKNLLRGEWGKWLLRDNLLPMIAMLCVGWSISSILEPSSSAFVSVFQIIATFLAVLASGIMAATEFRLTVANYFNGLKKLSKD